MRERLFTQVELDYVAPKADPVPSLAARFAAREAVMKAMGLGLGAFGFHEVWVEVDAATGEPSLRVDGAAERLAIERGITRWHLSLAHDGGVATAMVVAASRRDRSSRSPARPAAADRSLARNGWLR